MRAISHWLVCFAGDPVKAATIVLSPCEDGAKPLRTAFSILPSQHLCRFISACLAFVCTAPSKIIEHIKRSYVHLSVKEGLIAGGLETQIMYNSSRIIQMIIVATVNRKRNFVVVVILHHVQPVFT